MIPQIFILSIIVFVLGALMPGDALTGMLDPNLDPAQIEAMREQLGLNKSWPQRYIDWITGILNGDWGRSWHHRQPVMSIIGQRISPTIQLSLLTVILSYLIALPLGLLAGRYNESFFDKAVNLYNFISYAIPSFVLGLFLIWIFGYTLGWFPTTGTVSPGLTPGTMEFAMSRLYHMILPAITLALLSTTGTIQYLRTGVIDAKSEDYVRTAKAKGVPDSVIYRKHIFRNSILPIAAFFGFTITGLIGGSVFIENVFTYPGMGKLFVESISLRDFSVMLAITLISGFMTLMGSLLSDIIMIFVDPRIRIK